MSAREPLPTYRLNQGGAIHAETSDPNLLALLRDNSTADQHPRTHQSPAPAPKSSASPQKKDPPSSPHKNASAPAQQSPQQHPQRKVAESPERKVAQSPARKPVESPARKAEESPVRKPAESPERKIAQSPTKKPTEPSKKDVSAAHSPVKQTAHPPARKEVSESPVHPVHYPVTGGGSPPGPGSHPVSQRAGERPVPIPRRSLSQNSLKDHQAAELTDRSDVPDNVTPSPVSETFSETDSHSSELAGLAPTPSRKSFALAEEAERERADDADSEGSDTELNAGGERVDKGDATPVASPQPGGQAHELGRDRADQRSFARQPPQQPTPSPGAATAAAALPAGRRPGSASPPPPAPRQTQGSRGGVAPSPRDVDPDPERFVAPYASRRLKDNNPGRSSVVSVSVTDEFGRQVEVPKNQSWSANQAARLKEKGSVEITPAQGKKEDNTPQRHGASGVTDSKDFDTGEKEEDVDLADSLEFPPTGNKAGTQQGGSPNDEDRDSDVTPTNERLRQTHSQGPSPTSEEEPVLRSYPNHSHSGRDPHPDNNSSAPHQLQPLSPTAHSLSPPSRRAASPPPQRPPTPPGSNPTQSSSHLAGGSNPKSNNSNSNLAAGSGSNTSSVRGTPVSILKKRGQPETPVVDRVYIESPSFTREEEDEYRFVSSRVDVHEEDEDHNTFRALDEQAVSRMDAAGARVARKPFKQVRYQDDEDRFEDRDEDYPQYRGPEEDLEQEPPQPTPTQRQYVLRSKNGSAQSGGERSGTGGREEPPPPAQPRARSLVLPSGPTYDPQDEEDLKRETSYQHELRGRVSSIQHKAEETLIPRLSLSQQEQDDNPYRDSLDVPDDFELDSERVPRGVHPQRRDSLEVYEDRLHQNMKNTQWGDPPAPPPPGGRGGGGGFQPQRQAYGNNVRQGYAEGGRGGAAYDQGGYSSDQGYDRQGQGYGDRQGQGYADRQGQGYADREGQGYGQEPPQRGYGDRPGGQGYGDRQGQGYGQGEPPRGYGDRQGYGQEPPARGYADRQGGYSENPNPRGGGGGGGGGGRGGGYSDYYEDQPPEPQRGGGQYGSYGPPPGRGGGGVDPRFNNQRPPPHPMQQQGGPGYYDDDPQGQGHYMDRRGPPNYSDAEPQEGFYLTEPRGYNPGVGGGPIYSQDYEDDDGGNPVFYGNRNPRVGAEGIDSDRYQSEDLSQRTPRNHPNPQLPPPLPLEPPKPSYDYVEHNKQDYGRSKKRDYKKIHDDQKVEEEKLNHIFIQPKVKGKKGHKSSRDTSPSRQPAIPENAEPEEGEGVEGFWAQRSASLANTKAARARGRKPGSNTGLGRGARYHSDSSLPNSGQARSPLQAIQPANSMQLVPAQGGQLSPSQAGYRGFDLQPISQQLITEDGQRISVDVNLRLISPTMGSGSEEVGGYGRQPAGRTGMQYPVTQPRYGTPDENETPRGRYSADDLQGSKGGALGRAGAGYVSDSTHDYTDPVYSTNPYKKIPPIPTSSEAPRSAPAQGEGSYMMSYLKEKEKVKSSDGTKPWYKVYSLKDYKRMQNEVRLGTRHLGPDLDNETFKERREKFQRQMEYAKAVKDKNTKEFVTKKPPAFPRSAETQEDIMNKRKVAIEYSKNVPRPTVKPKPSPYNNYEMASKLSPIAKNSRSQHQTPTNEGVEVMDLEKLHQRHEADKQSAEIIRQKAHGMVS